MNASELTSLVERIQEEFAAQWTWQAEDLHRAPADEVLHGLIQKWGGDDQERLKQEFFGMGPLTPLLQDQDVQEIIVNGPFDIWYERHGRRHFHDDQFLNPNTFKNFVDRLCAEAGLKVDLAVPFADGRWREFRLHVTMAPLTHCECHVSLRRLRETGWTFSQLLEREWATSAEIAILRRWIVERKNFLIVGPTGSGKTSVLGACLKELPALERVIVIEDTDELPRPNRASTKLLTRTSNLGELREVTLSDLVRQSLRMRPDRLVLGEVRSGEAKDLLLALATGHSGGMGTLHASSPHQALLRLEMLIQIGAPQWSVQTVRQLIHQCLDGLVICGLEEGRRKLIGLHRIAALESIGFLLEPAHLTA